uniref:Metalloendopeptidase n=1 Tax=Parastrongyloides trichosuri TaxID=131310 RepID=A0A0N4ZWL5_PARTI
MSIFLFLILYYNFKKESNFVKNVINSLNYDDKKINKRSIIKNWWGNWSFPIKYSVGEGLDKATIKLALVNLNQSTCLTFEETASIAPGNHGILFKLDSSVCYSLIGRSTSTGPQEILLTRECSETVGTVQHEVFHALGMHHEHRRSDRDNNIIILEDNIEQDKYTKEAMIDTDPFYYSNFGIPYEYNSLLHYSKAVYSKNGAFTIVAKNLVFYTYMMGQREKPSFNDLKLVNTFYCSDKCKDIGVQCENGGYKHWNQCNQCICPNSYYGYACRYVKELPGSKCSNVSITAQHRNNTITVKGNKQCNFLIKTNEDKRVRVIVTSVKTYYKKICTPTIGLQIKHLKDKSITGLCICGSYENIYIISEGNDVYIEYNGYEESNEVTIKYSIAPRTNATSMLCYEGFCYVKKGDYYEKYRAVKKTRFVSIKNGSLSNKS